MSPLRVFFVIVFSMVILVETADSSQDVIAEANLCFENKEFAKGKKILDKELKAIRKLEQGGIKNEKTELKPALILTQAQFYENYVGDLKKAKRFYNLVTQLGLSDTRKELLSAQDGIKRIDAFNTKYNSQLQFLQKVNRHVFGLGDKQQDEKIVGMLSDFVSNTKDEQLSALAHYYLGHLFFNKKQQEPWQSYKAICKSLELRPALGYYLPVVDRKEAAYEQWFLNLITRFVWATTAVLLVFIALVFYFSRPWQWFNFRMVVFVLSVNLLFAAFFALAMWLVIKMTTLPENYMSPPVYFRTDLGGFNSLIPTKFFLYTLAALGGTICLVVSTLRFKHRWTWRLINVIIVGVLFTTIYSVFVMRYCREPSEYSLNSFYREKGDTFSYLTGTTYFRLRDVRPFVLTNPRLYPDLGTAKMDEKVFESWLKKQNEIIKSSQQPTDP